MTAALIDSFNTEILGFEKYSIESSSLPCYNFGGVDVECVPANYDLRQFLMNKTRSGVEGGFFTVDLGIIRKQLAMWRKLLPRVAPYYAMKCNPNPIIVKLLAKLGVNFDCASRQEIQQVLDLGVSAERIIFANPAKMTPHISYARDNFVDMMTFDCVDELIKIKEVHPTAKLVLRLAPDDSHAVCRLSAKFGAQVADCEEIIQAAVRLGLNVVGVSFHVGSGSQDAFAVPNALRMARHVFDLAAQYGVEMTLLDIGGGFPGTPDWNPSFPTIAAAISPMLDELFPREVQVIGEPGRFFVAHSHVLCTNVYARRMVASRPGKDGAMTPAHAFYYLDDGVYGSFSCTFFDHQSPQPVPLLKDSEDVPQDMRCTLFGPTCDALDTIAKDIVMPELQIGDWLYWINMGAYTTASTTKFNGFLTTTFFYVDSDSHALTELSD
eukprot:TRINITY_DN4969_c0_g1_i1.p1 TRINITY_DN4969_c0_g1~~TRINITY_DN4969_c0_g1_i1.p1  ORF type:complete len:438 (-),score=82.16 TRINITY_DN4969_c0_g1_i1:90-1403(-)